MPFSAPALAVPGIALLLLLLSAVGARAQEADPVAAPPLAFRVDPGDGTAAAVLGDIFGDERLVGALRDGLPVRLNVRVELWRSGGIVDRLAGAHAWRAVALFDPVSEGYELRVGREDAGEVERRSFGTLRRLRRAVRDTLELPLTPERGGRYYYLGTLEVETLSLSDIEELQRWLRGELGPSVRGERGVGSALAGGLRRLLVRILGLPVRRYRTESDPFRVPGD